MESKFILLGRRKVSSVQGSSSSTKNYIYMREIEEKIKFNIVHGGILTDVIFQRQAIRGLYDILSKERVRDLGIQIGEKQ